MEIRDIGANNIRDTLNAVTKTLEDKASLGEVKKMQLTLENSASKVDGVVRDIEIIRI